MQLQTDASLVAVEICPDYCRRLLADCSKVADRQHYSSKDKQIYLSKFVTNHLKFDINLKGSQVYTLQSFCSKSAGRV